MFNFLDSKLLPKIRCNKPCTDNYEVENLINGQYANKLRGFIAYPTIKPPVEIELEFICNINISYLVLNTTVGNMRCSGIELLARSSNTPYVSISKAFYDAEGVIFCNSRKYSKETPPPSYNASYALNFFKGNTFRAFLNVAVLKIIIFRTSRSVPCIASVEVWGIPSKTCSSKTRETVNKLMGHYLPKENTENFKNEAQISNVNDNSDFLVPDDFKDDLTYELMTIPYTLPSGKSVDQTTLEKHNKVEESFGRKPCDPFTGIKFNEKLKPILNVPLKSRIDMFLLENSHRPETFGLKRSLRTNNCDNKRLKSSTIEITANSHANSYMGNLVNKSGETPSPQTFASSKSTGENVCVLCKSSFQYLYQLPCEHCFCRKCLLVICENSKCDICNTIFVKSDIKKYYL